MYTQQFHQKSFFTTCLKLPNHCTLKILILLFIHRYLKVSVMSTILLLIISWIVTICVSLHFEYMHKVADPFESFDYLYKMPYQRFGPYAMGKLIFLIIDPLTCVRFIYSHSYSIVHSKTAFSSISVS